MFLFLATFVSPLPRTLIRDMRIFVLTILFTFYLLIVPFIGLYITQERVYAKIEAFKSTLSLSLQDSSERPVIAFDLK